jgi:LysR family transcriptional regulator, glycine cleavage system transcriptional activator
MAELSHNVPSLDLLRGFEAAARHLNFTRAADELFVTQSAISRQIKALEERLDVPLFVRQSKGLRLTAAGEQLYRAVSSALRQVNEAMQGLSRQDGALVTVTSTMSFCSLWLIPRLVQFNKSHPEVKVRIAANDRVLNLERERIDVSVRYCTPSGAPKGATWLFDEELLPVCSPALLDVPGRPLREPKDLQHHVLLHLDDPDNPSPWLSWRTWLDAAGAGSLTASGWLVFNYFEQMTRAALAGSGVALGRTVLVQDLLEDGSLVAPFAQRVRTDRGYCLVEAAQARGRAEVAQFAQWLIETARPGGKPPPAATKAGKTKRPPGKRRAR